MWERQRILRPGRAMEIAESIIASRKSGKTPFGGHRLPGVVTFYRHKEDDGNEVATGILDGQHRIGALMILSENGAWDASNHNILCDVFDTEGEDDIAALFRDMYVRFK